MNTNLLLEMVEPICMYIAVPVLPIGDRVGWDNKIPNHIMKT